MENQMKEVLNCCQPLFLLFKFVGFNLDFSLHENFVANFVARLIFSVFSVLLLIKQIYAIYFNRFCVLTVLGNQFDIYAMYLTFLGLLVHRGPNVKLFIQTLFASLVSFAQLNNALDEVKARLKNQVRVSLMLILLSVCVDFYLALISHVSPSHLSRDFTIQMNLYANRHVDLFIAELRLPFAFHFTLFLLAQLIYLCSILAADLLLAFFTTLFHLLGLSLEQVNRMVVLDLSGARRVHFHRHRTLMSLMDRCNCLFSPFLLILVLTRSVNVVTSLVIPTKILAANSEHNSPFIMLIFFKHILLFLHFIHTAHNVHSLSEKLFEHLSLKHVEEWRDNWWEPKRLIAKDFYVNVMYTCNWLTAPPKLKASGWLILDYHLIAKIAPFILLILAFPDLIG